MNILAIETATTACAVGLGTADGHERHRVVNEDRHHTEALTPAIAELLAESGLVARDLERVVVDRGPGLFTGLRVGLATAIALAQGVGADLVGVTSLEVLARGAYDDGVRGRLVSAVDGRRGEIFVQVFELSNGVEVVNAARVHVARSVVIEWATNGAPVTFTGDGIARYLDDFNAVPNGTIHHCSTPPTRAALALGAEREGEAFVSPLYLREADAVANFTTRERPR